ncbi:MAG: NAD(P)/FAD-dependent oxidoreductase [Actinomycetota bacterium]|nr:NAD(P)/FAD-dependent oxidoreductase [Actinomycetota bacterium]
MTAVDNPAPNATGVAIERVEIVVIGTGFAGLAMASRLLTEGFTDLVVLERATEVGGTWRDNTYPGAGCDIPSHLYSLSFNPNPGWSRDYSRQPEILDYLRDSADRFGVTPHIRFGHTVTGAAWEDGEARWTVTTDRGRFSARFLLAGAGPLAEPVLPDIPGLAEFAGRVWHSARWDHDADLRGSRVAVIGTGASAIQFVPEIQAEVDHLTLFQRTPPWILPRWDKPIGSRRQRLYRLFPPAQKLSRAMLFWRQEALFIAFKGAGRRFRLVETLARSYLKSRIKDPALAAKVTPTYALGCKRILMSDDYYPALTKANIEVVTDRITEITASGVRTADGTEHPVDTIVFGTGFHAVDPPMAEFTTGRDGVVMAEAWKDGMEAYKGTTVAGFPNLFFIIGPNTGLGHNSMVYIIESQVAYIMDCLRRTRDQGIGVVEVRRDAQDRWNEQIQEEMSGTVWIQGGCTSWYLDRGRNTTLWPGYASQFRKATRQFDAAAYDLRRSKVPATA